MYLGQIKYLLFTIQGSVVKGGWEETLQGAYFFP
jgi:hypothetical protein